MALIKHSTTKGFTLIELVVVIVILGILAATALPKFVDLGKDARIAQVNALAGTLKSTAEMWHGVCEIKDSCPTTGTGGVLNYQGRNVWFSNRYPDAGDTINDRQIDTLVDASGFTVSLDSASITRFSLSGAPTPTTCAVTYRVATFNATTGVLTPPLITTYVAGCE